MTTVFNTFFNLSCSKNHFFSSIFYLARGKTCVPLDSVMQVRFRVWSEDNGCKLCESYVLRIYSSPSSSSPPGHQRPDLIHRSKWYLASSGSIAKSLLIKGRKQHGLPAETYLRQRFGALECHAFQSTLATQLATTQTLLVGL